MSPTKNSPLKELLVDREVLDEFLLKDILQPFIAIEKSSGEYVFKPKYKTLNLQQRILIVILGEKVRKRLGIVDREEISPKKLESLTGEKGSSIRVALKRLKDRGLIIARNGLYSVHNSMLYEIKEFIFGVEDDDRK